MAIIVADPGWRLRAVPFAAPACVRLASYIFYTVNLDSTNNAIEWKLGLEQACVKDGKEQHIAKFSGPKVNKKVVAAKGLERKCPGGVSADIH